jgi:hypothetical protein
MNLKFKLNRLNYLINNSVNNKQLIEDNLSLQCLGNLLYKEPIIPITEKTLRPFVLHFLVNEIIINNRRSIIEFGSGISTIIICRLFRYNKIKPQFFISVEHNFEWFKFIKEQLELESLSSYVDLIYAPLEKFKVGQNEYTWYKRNDITINNLFFDLVLVDGPPANKEEILESRYPALPFVNRNLLESCAIFLDDANRGGEKKVLLRWQKEFNLKFKLYGETIGICYIGIHFESNPSISEVVSLT